MSDLPQAETADPDGVQVALRAAHTLWSRGDTNESLRWLRRAAESASDEGADVRSLQLAKAAAELRAKLFGSGESAVESSRAAAPSDAKGSQPATTDDAASVASSRPSAAPQYVVHRPRESPRPVMGLSSSSLETALQRDSASYPSAPSWSADAERRLASAPPPLPRSLDEYEELDAEPEEESSNHEESRWAGQSSPAWRTAEPAREVLSEARLERADAPSRVATLPPPFSAVPPPAFGSGASSGLDGAGLDGSGMASSMTSSPPPLPRNPHFDDDGELELGAHAGVLVPPLSDGQAFTPSSGSRQVRPFALQDGTWDAATRGGSWEPPAPAWDNEPRSASWGGSPAAPDGQLSSEPSPAKLTARVHHQAVRVSLAPDARSPGQYVVRPLREGERPSAGERVALLVALEPGQPLV